MTLAVDQPLAAWSHTTADVARRGHAVEREATPEERRRLASALSVPEIKRLIVRYRLTALGGDRFSLSGDMTADIVQACVVTLEPVAATLKLPLEAEFRADGDARPVPVSEGDEAEVLALPDYEPIEGGQLMVGRVVAEVLAAGLDPYPRQPGAEFNWSDEAGARAISPFAALAKLKREP